MSTREAKSARIDLGLELLMRRARPGVPLHQKDIAAWLGCSQALIYQIETSGLKRAANLLRFGRLQRVHRELRSA
jgi:predicted transcriptional regulator